eukprot:4546453-Pyramimonas_sp.AAC.1
MRGAAPPQVTMFQLLLARRSRGWVDHQRLANGLAGSDHPNGSEHVAKFLFPGDCRGCGAGR